MKDYSADFLQSIKSGACFHYSHMYQEFVAMCFISSNREARMQKLIKNKYYEAAHQLKTISLQLDLCAGR